jgi:uncharacterized repeat protein (TIGR01451 family)
MVNMHKSQARRLPLPSRLAAVVGLVLILLLASSSLGFAQEEAPFVRQVRIIEPDELGVANPAGLAFSPAGDVFYVVGARQPERSPASLSDVAVVATSMKDQLGRVSLLAAIPDPINMAFDSKANRLLLFQPATLEFVEMVVGPGGQLDATTPIFHDARRFRLQDPQGMAIDPSSGRIFLLDNTGPRIVRIDPYVDAGFANAVVTRVDLAPADLSDLRGLAFNPANGHLYTQSPARQTLYELTPAGNVVSTWDISSFALSHPQGLVFAPTGDLTDDPSLTSLYIADSGLGASLDAGPARQPTIQTTGHIVELSFDEMAPMAINADVTATLVHTIDTSLFVPPSPDPSGIAYLESQGTILVSDSEVDEMPPYFTGDNLFEMTPSGSLVDTSTTMPFTPEPTGIDYDPVNGLLFFSDDDKKSVFVVDLGPNGVYDPTDDRTSFRTDLFESGDPEGVAFDTWDRVLFIADGVNSEVYRVDPGDNEVFDGVPAAGGDDVVTHFDTAGLGIGDPGGITFDPENGYLYVIGSPPTRIAHITTTGSLVRTIDISAAAVLLGGGLAMAPGSQNPGVMNIYVTDRGIDNGDDPLENDGKIYEFYVPAIQPDVTIHKSVQPAFASEGDTIAYTLTFSNAGGGTASGVFITDTIPADLTVQSVISSGVEITNIGATLPYVWQVQDLTTADHGVIVVTAELSSSLSCFDPVTNIATIATSSTDTRPGNNSSDVTIAAGAGVSVDPLSDSQSANQGQSVVYTVRVTNEGTCPDSFDVSVSGTAWTVTPSSYSVGPLEQGDFEDVEITVDVPSDALCGPESAVITFTSQGASSASASSELVTTVNTVRGITVTPASATLSGLPGAELPYTLRVTNIGNCADTFDLAVPQNSWITGAPDAVGPLLPGFGYDVDVIATVPVDALCTDQDVATVTFTSSDGTPSASSILTSLTLPVYAVTVEPPTATASAAPGTDAAYTLRVTNIGNCTDTFDFSAAGDDWPASALPPAVTLAPAAYADVGVAVAVPSGAQCGASDSATVTFTSSDDSASDWSLLTTSVSTVRSLSVVPPAPALSGNPGSDVTYTLWVHNEGNCADTVDVSVSGTSWSVSTEYTEMQLAPNQLLSIDVTVHVPTTAQCGPETATVTFTSSDGVTSDASTLTTTVNPVYGVTVVPPNDTASADPGTNAAYSLRVTNVGNCVDTFAFSATGDQWPASALPPAVTLDPDEYADVDVSVAVPSGAMCGDNDDATVTFTSQTQGTVSDSSTLVTSANAVPAVTVAPSSAIGSAMPGFDAIYTLRVTNMGNCRDAFDFSAIGDQWTASALPPVVTLDPDEYADVDVSVAVPSNALCTDSDIATVLFTSSDDTASDSSTLTTSAGAIRGVTVEPPSDSTSADPGANAAYTLRVTNIGNCVDTFTFSATGDQWPASAPAVELDPDEYADVDVTVAVPSDARCGENDSAIVTFTSAGSGAISDSSDLTTSANTVYGVTVEPSVAALSGVPDTDVTYSLWVTNTGNCSDTFDRSYSGGTWLVSSVPVVGPLDPDAGAHVDVTVSVPACTLGGISDGMTAKYTSQHNETTVGSAALTTSADFVAPVAVGDQYSVQEDQSLVETAPGVLDNDDDANCESLTASINTLPAHGTVLLDPEGSFAYTPTLNFHGVDTFTYDASDGALSGTGTVTITVTSAGDDPIVNAGPDQPGEGDPPIKEGDSVSFSGSFLDPARQILLSEETIVWNFGDGNTASGVLTPTHTYGDNGEYAVTLTVTDTQGDVGQDFLTVTVLNVAPTVDAGPDQKAEPGDLLSFTGSFTDPGTDDTHTFHWDLGDGTTIDDLLTFDHTFAAAGDYAVTLTVTDDDGGVGTDTAIVSVRLKVYLPLIFKINRP